MDVRKWQSFPPSSNLGRRWNYWASNRKFTRVIKCLWAGWVGKAAGERIKMKATNNHLARGWWLQTGSQETLVYGSNVRRRTARYATALCKHRVDSKLIQQKKMICIKKRLEWNKKRSLTTELGKNWDIQGTARVRNLEVNGEEEQNLSNHFDWTKREISRERMLLKSNYKTLGNGKTQRNRLKQNLVSSSVIVHLLRMLDVDAENSEKIQAGLSLLEVHDDGLVAKFAKSNENGFWVHMNWKMSPNSADSP